MPKPITVVAFGDSITQAIHQAPEPGWTVLLDRMLRERLPSPPVKIINAGVGGNTSREGLLRIEADVLAHHPDFVTVEFGNDLTHMPERHVKLDEFAANLDQIRRKVAAHCNGRVILLTFPPILDAWHSHANHEFYETSGGMDAMQERYRECTRKFAQQHGLPLVDIDKALRKEMSTHGPEKILLPDGVHLTAEANRIVAKVVFEALRGEIE